MQLGAFSISLAVKDIGASRAIYAWGTWAPSLRSNRRTRRRAAPHGDSNARRLEVKPTLQYAAIRTSKAFDDFLGPCT